MQDRGKMATIIFTPTMGHKPRRIRRFRASVMGAGCPQPSDLSRYRTNPRRGSDLLQAIPGKRRRRRLRALRQL